MNPYLKDAIQFHPSLNRKIWGPEKMRPEVREDLLLIMDDFKEFLGVEDLYVVDVTVSGSMAAYTYTPHSDIDLHLVVRTPTNQTGLYAELFDAKKSLYNLTRHIKVRGYDVELYVQNVHDPVKSMGIYSVLTDRWIDYPKRIRAEIDDLSVLSKVDVYTVRMMNAIDGEDLEVAKKVWDDYREMRKSGLAAGGELSPENLAFKILRTRGLSKKLYDRILELKDKQLSLEAVQEQQVDEVFDKKITKRVIQNSANHYVAVADIGEGKIVFDAEEPGEDDGDEPGTWDIVFKQNAPNVDATNEFGMTGNGNEFEVMGFIKDCIAEFIRDYQPQVIRFSADKLEQDDSRSSVYSKMLKRYCPPNYTMEVRKARLHTFFVMTKTN